MWKVILKKIYTEIEFRFYDFEEATAFIETGLRNSEDVEVIIAFENDELKSVEAVEEGEE